MTLVKKMLNCTQCFGSGSAFDPHSIAKFYLPFKFFWFFTVLPGSGSGFRMDPHSFSKLNPDPDLLQKLNPDPDSLKKLNPDPHTVNVDPKH
jgi:hypothetical protein